MRHKIFPIVKQWSWIKKAKDSLYGGSEGKHQLITKHLSSINQGTVYAIVEDPTETLRLISSADISYWQITEKDLIKQARENFLKKVAVLERSSPLFMETQTGVYFCTRLKYMTTSLLAAPEVFNMIPIKSNSNYVVAMPTSNIVLVSHCHDARGLSIIGEACLRHISRDSTNTSINRSIRIDKKGALSFYEASMVRNEATFPLTDDQLKTCKKSVFKRSRKLSSGNL